MTHEERQKAVEEISKICIEIGCSKIDSSCPGNPRCNILRKIFIGKEEKKHKNNL